MHISSPFARVALALLAAVLVASLTGCSAGSDLSRGYDEVMTEPSFAPAVDGSEGFSYTDDQAQEMSLEAKDSAGYATGTDAANVPAADRLVILTAGVRVKVDEVESAANEVRAAAEKVGGIVTNVQISTEEAVPVYRYDSEGTLADGAALSGYITVRVPADSYDAFLSTVGEMGEIVRQSESESDVTQEHIDLAARLDNLKAQELRLREFTEQADNVEELLAIEQELTRVRSEIDSLSGQIAYLERQAAMSTVTIELVGPTPVVRPQGQNWGFVDALTQSIRAFVGTINAMIVLLGALLPVAVLAFVLFLIIRALMRRKHTTPPPAEETTQ